MIDVDVNEQVADHRRKAIHREQFLNLTIKRFAYFFVLHLWEVRECRQKLFIHVAFLKKGSSLQINSKHPKGWGDELSISSSQFKLTMHHGDQRLL